MIQLVEAWNYRCLRYIKQELKNFQILAGPNASGKTTFLDIFAFLSDLLRKGPLQAVQSRAPDCKDLFWGKDGTNFQLGVEFITPEERKNKLSNPNYIHCRYEISIGLSGEKEEISILSEKLVLKGAHSAVEPGQLKLFPEPLPFPPQGIISPTGVRGTKTVVNKLPTGNDTYHDETGKGWDHSFKLGPFKSSLASIPDDESKFPVATWVKRFLLEGVQTLKLNSLLMRRPSPPGLPKTLSMDGANLPWVVNVLEKTNPDRKREWIDHLRTALPDIKDISTVIRPEDKHCYLKLHYENGFDVPSWLVSDGTLRMMALTLLAYIPDTEGAYLIEEPENGIHPGALEAVLQSLSSVYGAQVFMATHSPIFLGLASPKDVLCFAKTEEGVTDIVSGDRHPKLRHWQGETNLGVLFAGGVLG